MSLFDKSAEEREDAINDAFFNVFSSVDGRLVLATMLEESGYFDKEVTPDDAMLRNFMNGVLYRVGVLSPKRLDSLGVADKFMELAANHRRSGRQ